MQVCSLLRFQHLFILSVCTICELYLMARDGGIWGWGCVCIQTHSDKVPGSLGRSWAAHVYQMPAQRADSVVYPGIVMNQQDHKKIKEPFETSLSIWAKTNPLQSGSRYTRMKRQIHFS